MRPSFTLRLWRIFRIGISKTYYTYNTSSKDDTWNGLHFDIMLGWRINRHTDKKWIELNGEP